MTPWTAAHRAPQSMGFSRQESWSGLLFPSPGDLPDPGIEPGSPALEADALTTEPPGKPWYGEIGADKRSSLSGTGAMQQQQGCPVAGLQRGSPFLHLMRMVPPRTGHQSSPRQNIYSFRSLSFLKLHFIIIF